MDIPLPHPEFPTGEVLARSFFEESIRHLEDAMTLHQAQRHPATIASALKAAEFGIKSVIVLDGAMGWWNDIFVTHTPLTSIDNAQKPFFQHHIIAIGNHNPTLVRAVKEMEKLVPTKPGGTYDTESQQNPEYPFLIYQTASVAKPSGFRLVKPSAHFGTAKSKEYYNTAQDLLTAITTQYATIGGWGLTLPASL